MLTVRGRRSSFNLQKVMWLVDELGLEHRPIEAGGQFGGLDAPAFRAMNPHGTRLESLLRPGLNSALLAGCLIGCSPSEDQLSQVG